MGFLERVENFLVGLFHELYYDTMIMENGYQLEDILGEICQVWNKLVSMLGSFWWMVISLWVSRPLVPHVFEVGGLHIENINLM